MAHELDSCASGVARAASTAGIMRRYSWTVGYRRRATPDQALPTSLVASRCGSGVGAERQLRAGDPAVVARIEEDRLMLDFRTVFEDEEGKLRARRVMRARDSFRQQ